MQWSIAGIFYKNLGEYEKAFEIYKYNNKYEQISELYILQNDYINALKYSNNVKISFQSLIKILFFSNKLNNRNI